MKTLDIEAVQAFVLVADLLSFTRAAEAMDATQSAVSLKIKRLETDLGRRLLERTPRRVRLSVEGDAFLAPARELLAAHQRALGAASEPQRRLVVGISHHVVGAELPRLLHEVRAAEPGVVVDLRISSSHEAFDGFERGMLDAAIVLRHDNRRLDGDLLLEESFGWMATPEFVHRSGEPLRLATQAEPCTIRAMALDALAQGGQPWTEVFVGGGVMTVGAAVSAGMAVAALGRRVAPPGTIDVGPRFGLPPLPSREVVLHTGVSDAPARNALRALSSAMRATAR